MQGRVCMAGTCCYEQLIHYKNYEMGQETLQDTDAQDSQACGAHVCVCGSDKQHLARPR